VDPLRGETVMQRAAKSVAKGLKAQLKALQDRHTEPSRVRVHRAISWLARAEAEAGDPDAQFIFLWVAFNAAYAREFGEGQTERNRLQAFLDLLVSLDGEAKLHALCFSQFSGAIRSLIDNRFVFEPFWKALREHDASNRWEEQFASSKRAALQAVMDARTATVLSIVVDRLYVLRNQLVHGGATWNSSVNRVQVRDGVSILAKMLPIVVEVMLANPDTDFGAVMYPVV